MLYRIKIVSYTHFFAEYNAGCVMSAVLQVPKEQNGCDCDDTVVLLFFVRKRNPKNQCGKEDIMMKSVCIRQTIAGVFLIAALLFCGGCGPEPLETQLPAIPIP